LLPLHHDDVLWQSIAAAIDNDLYSESPRLTGPFLVTTATDNNHDHNNLLQAYADESELIQPLPTYPTALSKKDDKESIAMMPAPEAFIPTVVVHVDGAWVVNDNNAVSTTSWDTSTIQVWDGLVSDALRRRLAAVVLGNDDLQLLDDSTNTASTPRWVRGGLSDTPSVNNNNNNSGSCWGLTDDAIHDLCWEHHDALHDMEMIISELFSDFVVSRFPEAVLGDAVSPLTANAPVAGDTFNWHVDGDPMLAPPSPWTDVYGRYPNRSRGRPRFVSLLVYLNNEWHSEWGATTDCLDVASGTVYSVAPQPGRCLVLDQDVTHTVTAPANAAAGRPRYSLVWKLILHPKHPQQDMRDLTCRRAWPEAVLLGSAAAADISAVVKGK